MIKSLFSLAAVPMLMGLACLAADGATRPNIIIVFTDDLDFDEIGVYDPIKYPTYTGAQKLGYTYGKNQGNASQKMWGVYPQPPSTPNIDSLARDGMLFTHFHVAATVCTPSRYALLTGQYASRSRTLQKECPTNGYADVQFNTELLPSQWNLAKGLKAAGYATGMVGKWHLGEQVEEQGVIRPPITDYKGKSTGPDKMTDPGVAERVAKVYRQGVDYIKANHGFDYVSSVYQENGNNLGLPKELSIAENNMEWFTAGALRFLEQSHDKPFFLYFAPNVPHGTFGDTFIKNDPRATPEGYVDWHLGSQPPRDGIIPRIKALGLVNQGAVFPYTAATPMWLDDGVGAILKKLEEYGIADNTIVIFSSDQQSRGKWTCNEGSHVPFLVRWPAKVKPGVVCDRWVSSVDVVPTLISLAGGTVPKDAEVDGERFCGELDPAEQSDPERPVLVEMGYGRAVVWKDWRYIAVRYPEARKESIMRRFDNQPDLSARGKLGGKGATFPNICDADQLYNLQTDPYEQNNLAANPEYAAKLEEMRTLMKQSLAPLPHPFAEFKPGR
ncbi:MAG: sulfatase-like hydrolase/transferase [Kiritimatiellales bacterium]|nr:sulfatase-like hydrolase/transferase [Kiritimatiellales bacterium]